MLNIPDALKHLFDGRQTRQSIFFSPFLTGTDDHIDALLHRALSIAEHPSIETDSPLTTPPSTPPSSPPASPHLDPTPTSISTPPSSRGPITSSAAKRTTRTRRVNVERDKLKSKKNKHRQRRAKQIAICVNVSAAQAHRPSTSLFSSAVILPEELGHESITPSSTGYIGVEKDLPERREYSREELLALGFRLHAHNPNAPCPILHSQTNSVMCLVQPAPPSDSTWPLLVRHLNQTIERLRSQCTFKPNRLTVKQRRLAQMGLGGPFALAERRGRFNHLTYGISFGNGQKFPQLLRHTARNKGVVEQIRNDPMFQRLTGWLSVGMLTWAPKLFLYYVQVMASLLTRYPRLHLPFQNSIFAAFTVNFGPATVCFPHRDIKNLAFGWCAITALGDYDWTLGGHLVLWDLKLMIEFPPGTTIYLPSATLCHLNTTIRPHEKRYSFTMFSAGGLFRWVEHGFQTEKVYSATVAAAQLAADNRKRWDNGLALFSTLAELRGGTHHT
ncbi:hypothetical protein VNI00_017636 [Paramarasmius palmivorus]|uniref:Uncharacterized protein n=1 Tax=Paramarasmius palmivorus TaxID=297713 RepID=A0AAW0B5J5_9AGAR